MKPTREDNINASARIVCWLFWALIFTLAVVPVWDWIGGK